MTLVVGRLKEQDKQDWLNLWNQADGWALKNDRLDIPESNWQEIISGNGRLLAFCLRDNTTGMVIGHILYRFNICVKTAGDECFICEIFVDPAFRKQGGGRKLMQAVEEDARQAHAGRISWLANPNRPESMEFYAGASAEQTDHTLFVRWLEPMKKAS